jgi:hypothetical protein
VTPVHPESLTLSHSYCHPHHSLQHSHKLIRSKHDKIFRTLGWPPLCHFEFLQTQRQATTQPVAGDVSTLSTVSTSAMTHHIDAIPGLLYAYDTTEKVDISSWVERTPGAVIVTDVLKWFTTTVRMQALTHLSRRWRMEQIQLKFIFTHLEKLSAKPQSALTSLLCGIYGGRRHENHPNISNALEAQLNKTYSHLLFNNISLTETHSIISHWGSVLARL